MSKKHRHVSYEELQAKIEGLKTQLENFKTTARKDGTTVLLSSLIAAAEEQIAELEAKLASTPESKFKPGFLARLFGAAKRTFGAVIRAAVWTVKAIGRGLRTTLKFVLQPFVALGLVLDASGATVIDRFRSKPKSKSEEIANNNDVLNARKEFEESAARAAA